mmetsp:Transcript_14526/g.40761  ORF Transcript_14526/g.40761 Transcript_14526/m.40761 type:complete len:207 (-) Transcript_14526:595-1215(-)
MAASARIVGLDWLVRPRSVEASPTLWVSRGLLRKFLWPQPVHSAPSDRCKDQEWTGAWLQQRVYLMPRERAATTDLLRRRCHKSGAPSKAAVALHCQPWARAMAERPNSSWRWTASRRPPPQAASICGRPSRSLLARGASLRRCCKLTLVRAWAVGVWVAVLSRPTPSSMGGASMSGRLCSSARCPLPSPSPSTHPSHRGLRAHRP